MDMMIGKQNRQVMHLTAGKENRQEIQTSQISQICVFAVRKQEPWDTYSLNVQA